jgi:hypothetical protein
MLLPAAGLCAGLGLTMAAAGGQPPDRKGPPPGESRERRPDPQVEAWIKTLTDKMTDPHDTIRDSARAGIVAAGRDALPILRRYADSDDGAKATAARKLIEAIERGGPRPMLMAGGPGAPPGFTGRLPMPPGDRPRDSDRPRGDRPGQPDRPAEPGRPGRPGGPGGPLEQAIKELGLNEKQLKQVTEIREGIEPKLREIMEQVRDGKLERGPEVREKMQKLQAEMMKEIKDVLTDEQFEKLQEAIRKIAPGGRPGERRPDRPKD